MPPKSIPMRSVQPIKPTQKPIEVETAAVLSQKPTVADPLKSPLDQPTLATQALEIATGLMGAPADRVGEVLEDLSINNPELHGWVQSTLRDLHAAKQGPVETVRTLQQKSPEAMTFQQEQARVAEANQRQTEVQAQLSPSTIIRATAQKIAALEPDQRAASLQRMERENHALFVDVSNALEEMSLNETGSSIGIGPSKQLPALDFDAEPELRTVLDVLQQAKDWLSVKDVDRLSGTGIMTRGYIDRLVAAGAAERSWQHGRGVFRGK